MKARIALFIILLLGPVYIIQAQNYTTAAGIRFGYFTGGTIKHFISATNAIEGMVSVRWGGLAVTGLYEWQKPVRGSANLDYFLGLGAHVGVWGDHYYWYRDDREGAFAIVGIDFIAGLEYTFPKAPFNVAFDWKPAFNLVGDTHWWGDGVALSVRYIF